MKQRTVIGVIACASAIALALAATGCGGDSCDDTVITPGGPAPRQCVHQVPNGAIVTTDDAGMTLIILNGKVIESDPPCPCASQGRIGPPPIGEMDASGDDRSSMDALGDRADAESIDANPATE